MVSADPLPQILREVRGTHAGVETSVVSGTSESLVKQILAGDLDAVFVRCRSRRAACTRNCSARTIWLRLLRRVMRWRNKKLSAHTRSPREIDSGRERRQYAATDRSVFCQAGVTLQVTMELSRLSAIKRMVEEDMGVGIVPLRSVQEEVAKGTLVRWWIEGAQINWQLEWRA